VGVRKDVDVAASRPVTTRGRAVRLEFLAMESDTAVATSPCVMINILRPIVYGKRDVLYIPARTCMMRWSRNVSP
jgi:hypothetical protein